jgi:multisubunit Na+/H+ antiporter MnhC subunit
MLMFNLKGTTMRLYLTAIVLTVASTAVILSTCIVHSSPTRAAPVKVMQFM